MNLLFEVEFSFECRTGNAFGAYHYMTTKKLNYWMVKFRSVLTKGTCQI